MSPPGEPTGPTVDPAEPPQLDRGAILLGAGVALVIVVPAGIGQGALSDTSSLKGLLLLASLVAYGLGGAVAGARVPDRHLTHGSLAGLVAVCGYVIIGIVERLFVSRPTSIVAIAFTALLGVSCGIVGAQLGARRSRRLAEREDGAEADHA